MVTRACRTHNMQRKTRVGQAKIQKIFAVDIRPWLNELAPPDLLRHKQKNGHFPCQK